MQYFWSGWNYLKHGLLRVSLEVLASWVSWILFREMKLIYSDVKMQEKKQRPGVPGANG